MFGLVIEATLFLKWTRADKGEENGPRAFGCFTET